MRDHDIKVPSADEVISALERILASSGLSPDSRRTSLLRHIVNQAVAGRPERLTGKAIAFDVFGRGADFDALNDSIVRTEARRVRHVLNSYYVGPGSHDPIRISIPKGTYVPKFERGPAGALAGDNQGGGEQTRPDAVSGTAGPAAPVTSASPGLEAGSSIRPRITRNIGFAVVVVASILAMVTASLWWNLRASDARATAISTPAVLVRPFKPAGDDALVGILAEGLTVRLIADLMKFPDFRLYTFDSSILRSESGDIPDGADIDYVVTGSVRGDAEFLSVVVQIVDVSDSRVLWSDVFSRAPDARWLFRLEEEISGRIANVIAHPYGIIRTEVASGIEDISHAAGMESFACVMRAYSYRFTNRSAAYPQIRECLEEAVLQDPDYAEAWAMLAFLRLDGIRFGYDEVSGDKMDAAFAAVRAAAARALILDPESEQALKALSTMEFYAGNYEESSRLARQAVDLNPNDPDALGQLGWRLIARAHFDEGLPYLEQAISRSVRPPPWYFQAIAAERMMRGDMPGMLAAAEQAEADGSSPSAAFLAIAQAGVGETEAALATVGVMAERWPLLGSDPARALSMHHVHESIIEAMIAGLRNAGWKPEAPVDGAESSATDP
jgi:TolB-like protein